MKVTSSVLPIATTVSIVQAPCHRPLHDLIVDTIVRATQLRLLWLKGFMCVYVLGKSRERYHPCKKQQDHMTTRPGNNKYKKLQSVVRTLRSKKQSDHLNAIELDNMPTQAGAHQNQQLRRFSPGKSPPQLGARTSKTDNCPSSISSHLLTWHFPRGTIDVHTPVRLIEALPWSRILESHSNFPGQGSGQLNLHR
jgi:hypothetical protein